MGNVNKKQVQTINKLTLPRLISDGMILQRNAKVRIWGYAPSRETIMISFLGETHTTISDIDSKWEIHLHDLSAGGPYDMEISTKKAGIVTIRNILVGDVYVCSGQSNMEHSLGSLAPHYNEEAAHCTNTMIRHFKVPVRYEFKEDKEDFEGGSWLYANPEDVMNFTAVGYFFAKELFAKYQVPIGLIGASQGGSPAEAWMSESALKSYPHFYDELKKYKEDAFVKQEIQHTQEEMNHWYTALYEKDLGDHQEGQVPWYRNELDISDWKTTSIPGYLNETEIGPLIGIIWLRKTIEVPTCMAGKEATLFLGTIQDADTVYINGTYIGEKGYLYPRRRYDVPENILKEGKNTITIRLISNSGPFGFVPGKEYAIVNEQGESIDLKGEWNYKISLIQDNPKPPELFLEWKPGALFKGMIAPILPYVIKGVVWYQGESNEKRAEEYRVLFPDLIKDWRKQFDIGDFPFLFVQLPNLGPFSPDFSNHGFAPLRDAQDSALTLPGTGMAVTYDLGEWNDLHPLDKASVGKRLAFIARKVAYGEQIVYTGPSLQSIKKNENGWILSFNNIGSGLTTTNGLPPKHFVLVDDEGVSTEAAAAIVDNKVLLEGDPNHSYIECRFAYSCNPETANLCNKEGFPAAPFRRKL